MLPDYSAALEQYSQVWGPGTVHNLSNIMDPYGTHYGTAALDPSEWLGRVGLPLLSSDCDSINALRWVTEDADASQTGSLMCP